MKVNNIENKLENQHDFYNFDIQIAKWCSENVYKTDTEEVEALKNQVFYGGMTVGRIGTIREFIQNVLGYAPTTTIIPSGYNFVKGKIIAMNISEDAHLMSEILNEINEGVYIGSAEV